MKDFLKKNWFLLIIAISVLVVAISFSYYHLVGLPQIQSQSLATATSTQHIQPSDFTFLTELFNQVISYNIAYLAASIVIIFALGIVFSFLNLKPLERKMEEHEASMGKIETDATLKLQALESRIIESNALSENKLNELSTRISNEMSALKNKQRADELQFILNQHWLWQMTNVHINDLNSLITYLEKALEYEMLWSIQLVLSEILRVLSIPDAFIITAFVNQQQRQELHSRLLNVMSRIVGFEAEKRNIFTVVNVLN